MHATNYACSHEITCNELLLHAMNYNCCCAIRAVRKNTHAGEVRLPFETITCNELPLHAMNYSYCCAIRAVRKNTHAGHDMTRQPTDSAVTGMQRSTPAPTRSRAMNYRCCCVLLHAMQYSYCCAIRAVRKNTHAGHDINRQPTDSAVTCMQRITPAPTRSRAMNYRCMQ